MDIDFNFSKEILLLPRKAALLAGPPLSFPFDLLPMGRCSSQVHGSILLFELDFIAVLFGASF